MFTVILLSESAKTIYEAARAYFEPFERDGSIAFCEWNQDPSARTMYDAVPDLPEVIKGKQSWRAVVVDHPRAETDPTVSESRDPENPFDFLDNDRLSLNLQHSNHALIRLAHILLGYPETSVKSFKPYLQFEHAETGELIEGHPRDLLLQECQSSTSSLTIDLSQQRSEQDWFTLGTQIFGSQHNNVRRHFIEEAYTGDEERVHQELVETYRMKEVRPSEVIFVATRAEVQANDKQVLQRAWNTDVEQNSSRFVERNDYPPMCRFAVYELLEEENSGYGQDLLRFWLSTLTLANNELPAGSFQSERLYRLKVDFADQGLAEMLNAHISQLAMVRDHLEHVIKAPGRPPEIELGDLLAPVKTKVVFDDLGAERLKVESSGYGLVSDKPRDELVRWNDDIAGVSVAATSFMGKPRRVVARSVLHARELFGRDQSAQVERLSDFDREELREELSKRMEGLINPGTTMLLDTGRIQRSIEEGDREVKKIIAGRMRAKTFFLSVAVVIAIWLAAFLPYLVQAARQGGEVLGQAAIATGIILAFIGLAAFIFLLVSRSKLLAKIKSVNQRIISEVKSVRLGSARFAEVLSEFITYRRGAQMLRTADRKKLNDVAELRRLRALKDRIIRHINEEKSIVLSLGRSVEVHRTSRGLIDFDVYDNRSVDRLFRFPTGERGIPFNDSGDQVVAPYDFVQRLHVQRVALFEHPLLDNDLAEERSL